LNVVHLAKKDKERKGYDCVFLSEDGSTLSTDGKMLLLVSPVDAQVESFGVDAVHPARIQPSGIGIPHAVVEKALRNLPSKPYRAIHKCAVLTECGSTIELSTTPDGVAADRASRPDPHVNYPSKSITAILRGIGENRRRVCVSLASLKKMVDALEKVTGRRGKQPLFLEVGSGEEAILIRTKVAETHQRVVGVLSPVEPGTWLEFDEWERELFARKTAKRKSAAERRLHK